MDRNAMKFGAHYLPTYVPDLDGPINEFYQRMFGQMEEMDRLGYDHIWVTEHHFAMYGGTLTASADLSVGDRANDKTDSSGRRNQRSAITQPARCGGVLRDGGCYFQRPLGFRRRKRQ